MIDTQSFTIVSDDFITNPYPFYEKLRSISPIYKGSFGKYPGWYITGYKEVVSILMDERFHNRIPIPKTTKKYTALKQTQDEMFLFKNKDEHMRLRKTMHEGFTPKAINRYRNYVESVVSDLLNVLKKKTNVDIVTEYAFPVASLTIAHILGVPKEDGPMFRKWALELIPTIDFSRSRKVLEQGNKLVTQLVPYFKQLIKKRKQSPQNDLISLLIHKQSEGNMTEDELVATCILLVIAGHETTVNLISNTVLCFLQNKEQYLLAKNNHKLVEQAIEEVLRYESPTQMLARTASVDCQIGEHFIKEGEQIYLLIGAANRDSNIFANPNEFQITRNPNPHLAFGHGKHFCIGSSLARLEAQIAIKELLKETNRIALLSDEIEWRKLVGFRALQKLEVSFQ